LSRWAVSFCPARHGAATTGARWWRQSFRRLEARLALEELALRYPPLRLAGDQELTFHPNVSFRGPQVLRVRTGEAP
jgi:hypothetical protein